MDKTITPMLLMVSGGSDSMALLHLAALHLSGKEPAGPTGRRLLSAWDSCFCDRSLLPACLHINHMLRGEASDGDEEFVKVACQSLGVPFQVERIDIPSLMCKGASSMEAVARDQRYLAANAALDSWCVRLGIPHWQGMILTAHTLDDRVETYLMRSLVGTGPGGLGSIPRRRDRIHRPLLDALREELREFLREQCPGMDDKDLWREDATNEDGSNFRSRVRMELMPRMRSLVPGFERNLARTMDLISEENDVLAAYAQSVVYRNLVVGKDMASISVVVLNSVDLPMARRILRQCLLVVNPQARLESRQINRVLMMMKEESKFSTEVDSGIRVTSDGDILHMVLLQRENPQL